MDIKIAISDSQNGSAERTDAKGQRWIANEFKGDITGKILYSDGRTLPLSLEICEKLKDWKPVVEKIKQRRIWP